MVFLSRCAVAPPPPAAHASLGVAQDALAQGAPQTSLEIARGVLTAEPRNTSALVMAADAQVALGDARGATRDYAAALAVDPADGPAKRGLAKLRLRNDPPGAEMSLRAILAHAPQDAASLTDLGVCLDLQERHAEAQASYQAALRAAPGLLSAQVDLGLSRALSGHAAEAEAGLREAAMQPGGGARARADLAVAQVLAGDDAGARTTLRTDLSAEQTTITIAALHRLQ